MVEARHCERHELEVLMRLVWLSVARGAIGKWEIQVYKSILTGSHIVFQHFDTSNCRLQNLGIAPLVRLGATDNLTTTPAVVITVYSICRCMTSPQSHRFYFYWREHACLINDDRIEERSDCSV
jgi:hypothetical protein